MIRGAARHVLGPVCHPRSSGWRRHPCNMPLRVRRGGALVWFTGPTSLASVGRSGTSVTVATESMAGPANSACLPYPTPDGGGRPGTIRPVKLTEGGAANVSTWSHRHDGLADRRSPASPSVHRRRPYPDCRARGAHARLVESDGVNAASCLSQEILSLNSLLGSARTSRPPRRHCGSRGRHVSHALLLLGSGDFLR
jgi:hypothetical protein